MVRVSESAVIDATAERTWDLYAHVEGSVDWVPFTEEVLWVSGPPGVGQAYRERTRLGGVATVDEWRVIEWDPPRRQVQESVARGMRTHLIIEVEPVGTRTRVTQSSELQSLLPPPIGWIQERAFAPIAKYGLRMAVRAAKRTLEGGAAGPV